MTVYLCFQQCGTFKPFLSVSLSLSVSQSLCLAVCTELCTYETYIMTVYLCFQQCGTFKPCLSVSVSLCLCLSVGVCVCVCLSVCLSLSLSLSLSSVNNYPFPPRVIWVFRLVQSSGIPGRITFPSACVQSYYLGPVCSRVPHIVVWLTLQLCKLGLLLC